MSGFNAGDIDWRFVNLAFRPNRRKHAEQQFMRHKLVVRRFDAFTPADWFGDPIKVARMLKTPGVIGGFMSHMHLIQLAQFSGRILGLCEDDVCFCDDLPKRLDYIAEHLTWDWDIFYLGALFHVPGQWCHHEDCKDWGRIGKDAEPTSDKHIMRVYGEWCTYAMLVNPINAAKVYRLFDENVHRARGLDHLTIILGPQLKAYCFVPGCAWQRDGPSDAREGGYTRFSSFKSMGPYVWTKNMGDFKPELFDWEKGGYRDV